MRRPKKPRLQRAFRFTRLVAERLEPRMVLTGMVSGVTFNDLNENGVFDASAGETPLAGRTVFVDLNGNYHLDAAEPSQLTGADGKYAFANLAAGSYAVRQVESLDYEPTTPTRLEPRTHVIDLTVNHLTYDPVRDKLYASISNLSAIYRNSIVVIDQVSGAITASVAIEGGAGLLALSDDGAKLYVTTNNSKDVQAVELATMTKGASFSLGNNRQVQSMQVVPGTSESLAISSYSADTANIAIFDHGVPRPKTVPSKQRIEFSADGSVLYGYGYDDSFVTMTVESEGLSIASEIPDFDRGGASEFKVADGRVYVFSGRVRDLQSGDLLGTLVTNSWPIEFEPAVERGLVYVATNDHTVFRRHLQAFDIQTFGLVGSLELPNSFGDTLQIVRTGSGKLALNLNCDQMVLVDWEPRAASHEVHVVDDQTVSLDLGNRPAEEPGSIRGQAFYDANESRTKSKGEPGLAGRTVFLDLNGNGVLDAGERSTVTDAAGNFAFDGLPPGSYTVAEVTAPGWELTSPSPQEHRMRQLNVATENLMYDAARDRIYAAVGSEQEVFGNSIVVINARTGRIEKAIDVGSRPGRPLMSRDGKALYVALQGINGVSRIDLTTLTKDLYFSLGTDLFDGPNFARNMEILGEGTETIAVLRSDGKLAIYDHGVPRPGVLNYKLGIDDLTSSPTTLYGSSHGKLLRFSVTASGVSLASELPSSLSHSLSYRDGLIYSGGKIIDPQTGAVIGQSPTGFGLSDPAESLGFGQIDFRVDAYDLTTRDLLRSIAVEGVDWLGDLIDAGEHLLAFQSRDETYFIDWNPRQPWIVREHNVIVGAGQTLTGIDFAEFKSAPVEAPIATSDSFRIPEPVATTIAAPGVLANDFDDEESTLSAVLVDGPTKGTVVLNADGGFTYTPGATFAGLDSFTYRAFDGHGLSDVKQVSITEALPGGPLALNDSFQFTEDTPRSYAAPGVLNNDTSATGKPLKAKLVTGANRGQLTLNEDGSFDYAPQENFFGKDQFTYRAADEDGISRVSTVTLTVTSRNDVPTGVEDSYATPQNTTLVVAARGVLANDLDPDSNPSLITAMLENGPAHGTLALNSNGSFSYFPATDYSGPDSFVYRVRDFNSTGSTVATVSLTVTPVADTPTARDESYTVGEDGVLTAGAGEILANDSDPKGLALTAVLATSVKHGKLTLSADGRFTYTPSKQFHGTDQFTYRANSQAGNSGLATVTLHVTPVNDPPVVFDDEFRGLQERPLSVAAPGVLRFESDMDHDVLRAVWVDGPANGTLDLRPDGSFEYVPKEGFFGIDRFRYRTSDGTVESRIVDVELEIESFGQIPVGLDDSIDILEDSPLRRIYPLANDTDANDYDFQLSAIVESQPEHGTLVVDEDGNLEYQPNRDYTGPDSFRYRPSDGVATGNVATVTINVLPFNDLPVAKPDEYSTDEETPLVVGAQGVLGNDADIDTAVLTVRPVSGPANGQLELEADGSFRYVPNKDFSGTDSFVYGVFDRQSAGGVMYALVDGPEWFNTTLYQIDLTTGAKQLLQTMSLANGQLEYLPDGRLFALTHSGLAEIEPETWRVHLINDSLSPSSIGGGLVYNPADGKLYAIADGPGESLMTVDPNTGQRTVVALLDFPIPDWELVYSRIGSIAFADDGWLYGTLVHQNLPDYLVRIDVVSGEVVIIGPTGMNDSGPLEFDPASGTLYMAAQSTLFAMNRESGGATPLKPPGGGSYLFSGMSVALPTAGPQSLTTVSINVAGINDAPSFVPGDDVYAMDEAGPVRIDNWAREISAEGPTGGETEGDQNLTFSVTTDDAGLFLAPPEITPNGSLLFTPKPGATGVARLTVVLRDDGATANGGVDVSGPQQFQIEIGRQRPWHNLDEPMDVTGDGDIVAGDALEVINFLNAFGSQQLSTSGLPEDDCLDVTGDGHVAADDALEVINYLNSQPSSAAEGEPTDDASVRDALFGLPEDNEIRSPGIDDWWTVIAEPLDVKSRRPRR